MMVEYDSHTRLHIVGKLLSFLSDTNLVNVIQKPRYKPDTSIIELIYFMTSSNRK